MYRHAVVVSVLAVTLAASAPVVATSAPVVATSAVQQGRGGPAPSATEPIEPRSMDRHIGFMELAMAGGIDLLFVGDSITDGWDNRGASVWDELFVPMNAANFGIGGDTTQGVLWRMQNGELEGFKARLIVHMLGTNNINRNPNADIARGNRLIVEEYRRRQPQAKVLLLGVFPRGVEADNPYRASIDEINARLSALDDGENVFYLDIGDQFLTDEGVLLPEIMPDGLHPNERGYEIWGSAIIERVRELME